MRCPALTLLLLPALACTSEVDELGPGAARRSDPPVDAGRAPTPDAGQGPDAGAAPDAGTAACVELDEAACALANCHSQFCPGCFGETYFLGCQATEGAIPCPVVVCPQTCAELDEASCLAAGDGCRANYCNDCMQDYFTHCSEPNDPPAPCPAVACTCAQLGEADCHQAAECHAVYQHEAQDCFCEAPGCCQRFAFCAQGSAADCAERQVACDQPAPYCDGPYTIGYRDGCYEGCVRQADCAP